MQNDKTNPPQSATATTWLAHLELLRKNRQKDPQATQLDNNLSDHQRQQSYQAYLTHWQTQHNFNAPKTQKPQFLLYQQWCQNNTTLIHTETHVHDTTFLLQPQFDIDPSNIAQQLDIADNNTPQHSPSTTTIPVHLSVHVIAPPADPNRPVVIVDEEALLARWQQKIIPHLSDAVAGMVKTALEQTLMRAGQEIYQDLMQELEPVIQEISANHIQELLKQEKINPKK